MSQPLNELEIKAALIDRLYDRGVLKGAALINEMVVANWSRRADIVVANGSLQAFEIKSDLDSLKRLDGQLSAYLVRFDKVTVICTSRFTKDVLERTPSSVEVLEALREKDKVTFRVRRRGMIRPVREKHILLSYLLKSELVDLLSVPSEAGLTLRSRHELMMAAGDLPVGVIRKKVLTSLRERYADTSEAFLRARTEKQFTNVDDLVTLRRNKQGGESERATGESNTPEVSPANIYEINWDVIADKFGELPAVMPGYVLKRLPVSKR